MTDYICGPDAIEPPAPASQPSSTTRARGLQGFNEAEAWRLVCDTWANADLSVTRSREPVLHWTAVLNDPVIGHLVTASGYTRFEMLRNLIVEMEREQRIEDEKLERQRG